MRNWMYQSEHQLKKIYLFLFSTILFNHQFNFLHNIDNIHQISKANILRIKNSSWQMIPPANIPSVRFLNYIQKIQFKDSSTRNVQQNCKTNKKTEIP